MELKDFTSPLLSQLGSMTSVVPTVPEEKTELTMVEATTEIEGMISNSLAQTKSTADEILHFRVSKDENLFVILTENALVTYDGSFKGRHSKKINELKPKFLELFNDDKHAILGRPGETKIFIYDLATLKFVKSVDTHKSKINKMFILPDHMSLLTLMDGEVLRWDLSNIDRIKVKCFVAESYDRAFISTNSQYIGFTQKGGGNQFFVHSLENKALVCSENIGMRIGQVEFAPSGNFVAISFAQTIKVKNLSNLQDYIAPIVLQEAVVTLNITKNQDIILAGTNRGNVILIDHKNSRKNIILNVHRSAIIKSTLNSDESKFYTVESEQKRKITTTQLPKLAFKRKIQNNAMILNFSPDNKLLIKSKDNSLKKLDFKKNEESYINSLEGINAVICKDEKIIISQLSRIVVFDSQNPPIQMEDPDNDIPMTLFTNQAGTILITGSKQKIKIWEMDTLAITNNWKAHEDVVSSFVLVKQETKLISGSYDNIIKVWDIATGNLDSQIKGHQGDINCLQITKDEKLLISSSSDKTIRIWNWERNILVNTINTVAPLIGIYLLDDEKHLISSTSDGRITYWSMTSYTRVFYNQVHDKMKQFIASPNGHYLAYAAADNDCYIVESPLFAKETGVSGPTEDYYQFLTYLKHIILKTDIPEHKPEMDDWIILPHFLTAQHYYAYSNLFTHLKRSLIEEFRYVETTFGQTPLSITMDKEYRDCRNLIVKSMIKTYAENPYSLSCLTKECLIDLNIEGFRGLIKLYELIFRRCQGYNLPTYVPEKVPLPTFYHSDEIVPFKENFIVEIPTPVDANGNPIAAAFIDDKDIYFMHCLVPLNLVTGSQESLDFLRSLLESPIQDIFRAELVQRVLEEKWNQIRWYMYPQGILYLLYLLLLNIYVIFFQDNSAFITAPFILSIVLSTYEAYQAFSAPLSYLEDLWNYLDLSRGALIIIYTIMVWSNADPKSDAYIVIITLAVFTSWIRGITYFRLYPPTRYMISLIMEVLNDMFSFMILLFYSTLAFSFIFLITERDNEKSFISYIANSYLFNLGESNSDGLNVIQAVTFLITTMINVIVMMNLLVSILGDTFDKVQESLEVADFTALAEMILEIETLLFWKRGIKEQSYFQLCAVDELKGGEDWAGKVRELKLLIKLMGDGQAKAISMSIDDHKTLKQQTEKTQQAIGQRRKDLEESLKSLKKLQSEFL